MYHRIVMARCVRAKNFDFTVEQHMYEDGDHVAAGARRHYTEIFVNRLRPLFAQTSTR